MARELNVLLSILCLTQVVVGKEQLVPCYFIFGDSLVDSGNNNDLDTLARANYQPYGIDFPGGVNGRFTNGRTVADFIGQLLGFPNFIPAYNEASDIDISIGINYGSGSAGIREESGSHLTSRNARRFTSSVRMWNLSVEAIVGTTSSSTRFWNMMSYRTRLFLDERDRGGKVEKAKAKEQ